MITKEEHYAFNCGWFDAVRGKDKRNASDEFGPYNGDYEAGYECGNEEARRLNEINNSTK